MSEMKWSGNGDENEMDELKWRMRWSEDGKRERFFYFFFGKYRVSGAPDFHFIFSV